MTTPAESWTYVLTVDRSRPLRERSAFTLRPMTVSELRATTAGMTDTETLPDGRRAVHRFARSQALRVALEHVVDARNFPADAPRAWPSSVPDRLAALELLHDEYVVELAAEVLAHASLDRDRERLVPLLYARAHAELGRALGGENFYSCKACAAMPSMMAILGHDGPPTSIYTRNLLTDEPLSRCPVRSLQLAAEAEPGLVGELHRFRDDYLPHYRHGHLLAAGGVSDQPARAMEFFALLEQVDAETLAKMQATTSQNRD